MLLLIRMPWVTTIKSIFTEIDKNNNLLKQAKQNNKSMYSDIYLNKKDVRYYLLKKEEY